MRTRVLPPEEYAKLARTNVKPITGLDQRNVDVVVVEDEDGEVIGCVSVMRATHFEGLWIDPAHRNAGVARALLGMSGAIGRGWGSSWAFAAAADERMRDILARLGGQRVPVDTFIVGIGGSECHP